MKRSSKIVLGAALALILAAGFLLLRGGWGAPPRPEAQIRSALQAAAAAAERRDVGGILDIVSDDYKDAALLSKDRLRLVLLNAMRQTRGARFQVRVSQNPDIVISPDKPDQAIVSTRVTVTSADTGELLWGGTQITLVMRREASRRWLVFPDERWRVVSTVNLPPLPGMNMSGGGLGGMLGL